MALKKRTGGLETESAETQAQVKAASRAAVRARVYLLWQELGMVVVLVILCVFMALFAPYFLTGSNLVNVAQQSSINAILAAGMTFVILTGGIDLSVGSGLAVAGVGAVWLASKGVPGIIAVLAGLGIGCLSGWVNGVLIAKFKLLPFIVTLGALTYLRGVAFVFTGGYPIVIPNLSFGFLGNGFVGPLPWPVVIALVVYVVGYIVLNRTIFGRHVYAIGGNEQAARLTGINSGRWRAHSPPSNPSKADSPPARSRVWSSSTTHTTRIRGLCERLSRLRAKPPTVSVPGSSLPSATCWNWVA